MSKEIKKTDKINRKIKREKIIVIAVLAVILLLAVIFVLFKLNVFSNTVVNEPEEEFLYSKYKQICSKDDDYFWELANLAGGSNKKFREIKRKSNHCETSKNEEISQDDIEDMDCECEERDIRKCQEGWELTGNFCYKDKLMTSSLKACSFYRCGGNYFVEVEKKEVV